MDCFSYISVGQEKTRFRIKESISELGKEVEEVRGSNLVSDLVNQSRNFNKNATSTGLRPYPRE